MKYVKYKWFFSWEYEKEENWLNEMSAIGLQLVSVNFMKYTFEDGKDGEYTYRIQLLDSSPSNIENIKYIKFLEELGIEHVATMSNWIYLRKKSADGEFELFSDLDMKIKQYNNIKIILAIPLPLNIINSSNNFGSYLKTKNSVSLTASIACLVVSILLIIGVFYMNKKIKSLRRERSIRE